MGSYLAGADIHDFLACLGKHALEKVSFGFSNSGIVEPECPKVFVEDTDEYAQCTDAASFSYKGKKEAAPDGWGEGIPKKDNQGWDEEPVGAASNHATALKAGWETAETHQVAGDGWGEKQATVQSADWDQNENNVDKANHISCEGGWGSKEEAVGDGWGSLGKSDISMAYPAAQTGNQDSIEGENRANAASKSGFMHSSRRSRITADFTDNCGANERQSGNLATSGTNRVPSGGRNMSGTADSDAGWTDDRAGASWKAGADDFGWGVINCEATTGANANQQGSGQDNWVEMACEKPSSELENPCFKNGSTNYDAWQTLPESQTSGGDGWGNDNTWNCKKSNDEAYNTASPGWDAMEAKQGSKRSIDFSQRTQRQNADERRSGKFAPSGSNSIPLGKRRTATVNNDEPESMMTVNKQSLGGEKDDPMGRVAEKNKAAQDSGWDTSNPEDSGKRRESSPTRLGINGWGVSDAEWGTMSVNKSSQGMDKQSMAKCDWNSKSFPEASADLNVWGLNAQTAKNAENNGCGLDVQTVKNADNDGWGLDAQTAKNADNDGWGLDVQTAKNADNDGWGLDVQTAKATDDDDTWGLDVQTAKNADDDAWGHVKLDSPSMPCGGFHTQPSKGYVEQDGTARPRKKVNRGSSGGDSWAGFAAKCPQSQSRRPRLRSLLSLPENSELDGLYKAANKILHHNDYQLGDKLNAEDERFILEKILVHHQDKEAKVGCGVDCIMIDSHAEHQVSCFWVVRTDGTRTDFSYWKCLERLYETNYSQAATTDGTKDETAKGSSHGGWGSGGAVKDVGDNGIMKGGLADLSESVPVPDQKEAKLNWDTGGTSFIEGVAERDAREVGATSSATSTQITHDQRDGWDTWAAYPKSPKCDQGHAEENTWEQGHGSAVSTSEQATRTVVLQEAALTGDGWGSS